MIYINRAADNKSIIIDVCKSKNGRPYDTPRISLSLGEAKELHLKLGRHIKEYMKEFSDKPTEGN